MSLQLEPPLTQTFPPESEVNIFSLMKTFCRVIQIAFLLVKLFQRFQNRYAACRCPDLDVFPCLFLFVSLVNFKDCIETVGGSQSFAWLERVVNQGGSQHEILRILQEVALTQSYYGLSPFWGVLRKNLGNSQYFCGFGFTNLEQLKIALWCPKRHALVNRPNAFCANSQAILPP